MAELREKETVASQFPKEEILKDYKIAFLSRLVSLLGRKEVLSGKAKFGIFGDGKEIAQVAMARFFRPGDWRSGYYRDQTFMFSIGATTVKQYFAQLYADSNPENDPASAGRQMNSHFSSRYIDEGKWQDQMQMANIFADCSPTGCQMARLLGLGYASKLYRELPIGSEANQFTQNGEEIAFGTIGNASTSEGVFWETLNAAGVLSVPMVLSVWDDGYGISVPNKFQTTKESISEVCSGFQIADDTNGIDIYQVPGWDYAALLSAYHEATVKARSKHIPSLIHVTEITQPQGHSTSGSHERYKSEQRLQFEDKMDCLAITREWILSEGIATAEELDVLERETENQVLTDQRQAWEMYLKPLEEERQQFLQVLVELQGSIPESGIENEIRKLKTLRTLGRKNLLSHARQLLFRLTAEGHSKACIPLSSFIQREMAVNIARYDAYLFDQSENATVEVRGVEATYDDHPESIDGRLVINRCFDHLLATDNRLFIIGEDVGKLGGVNLEFDGLSDKHGDWRVTDTGIREATIVGQAIGAAARGLRPIADIQYLDYLIYGLQVLSDDLASLHYRSAGGQLAPVIVRTKGHRLEGIWHTGSPMGMIVNALRGMHVCVPRNMVQAAGFYNTLLAGNDPALVVEVLNGYRLKEEVPNNLQQFRLPLGVPEVLKEGFDISVVTYGACVTLCLQAAEVLEKVGISMEVIDVQTLLPFDVDHKIVDSVSKTNVLLVVDEDVPSGASAYILREIVEKQSAYDWLDSPPQTLSAREHRSPYGTDGDYFTKPSCEDIVEKVYQMIIERDPSRGCQLFGQED